MNKRETFTIGQAAHRVRRSKRTIQRWLNQDGMRFHWKRGRKMIRLDDLLLHYRRSLTARPSNSPEYRRKKLASES
jgi:excisionase family DNA binding protein